MRIMITGGLGHIGSCLIRQIPDQHDVIVVDNLSSQRYCSLFSLTRKITFLEKSVEDITVSDLGTVDAVIHLAAYTNAAKSFDAKSALDRNVKDAKDLALKCVHTKVKAFLFPSTASVYGSDVETMVEDDESLINPQSPYALSKWKIENLLKETLGNDTKFIIVRFGTIFGSSPGMGFQTAINKFCFQVSCGVPLTVWRENLEFMRPYLGVKDACKSIIHLLEGPESYKNKTYNILSGNYNLSDIIESLKNKVPNLELNLIKSPLINQHSYKVSDTKIRSTGYVPTQDLNEEISNTLVLLSGIK
ncbi:MAG: nucleoside-diphosphate sugar epimerase [Flammeovirgaceae bacterium]|nr:nucleoside-diphosphate sugar epimerase [Flammeovirgaceae bacterium]